MRPRRASLLYWLRSSAGEIVVIARNNRPIAKLVAIKPEPRTFGLRSFRVPDDFDAPLSSQELSMWA